MIYFTEIIKKVNEDKRLVPDLMKSDKGNNFRAVSESAILDVVDPVLKAFGWFYTVEIKKSDLQIREAYGKNGKKLQFIATVEVKLNFMEEDEARWHIVTEAVGMGIDDNDKAMGKAYTYAVKYALLKLFRLRYSDDPDFKPSEPLHTEKPKEPKEEKTVQKNSTEKAMTPAQRDYILGMMDDKGISSQMIMGKFGGCDPVDDDYIPMKTARAIIKWLEEQEKLPF